MPQQISRRDALAGAGVGALSVGVLGACESEGPGGTPTLESAVTVPASQVPAGGGYIDKDARVVVTQPETGSYHAFSAICPHRKCIVSRVDSSGIVCACHLSVFDPTSGARTAGPAPSGLTVYTVQVDGDQLTVS